MQRHSNYSMNLTRKVQNKTNKNRTQAFLRLSHKLHQMLRKYRLTHGKSAKQLQKQLI